MISIICPIYNEERYIADCIESILQQDYNQEDMEVLLIDGMSTDRTREIIKDYTNKYPQVRLLDNPHRGIPYALNIGIKSSIGEIIVRVDAHCSYPNNYVSRLVYELRRLKAENVGAQINTRPANNTVECLAIAIGSSHRFGVGNSIFRVGASEVRKVDTVPFGCYNRKIFASVGLYDEKLACNEDYEFNARIINRGGSIYIIPDVVIDYMARDSMSKMRKMYYQYGLFKPLANKKLGKPATIRQFFPLLFVVGLILGALASLVNVWLFVAYATILLLYTGIGAYVGLSSVKKYHKASLLWLMPYTFFNMHICYGVGYLKGIYNLMMHKDFSAKSNH